MTGLKFSLPTACQNLPDMSGHPLGVSELGDIPSSESPGKSQPWYKYDDSNLKTWLASNTTNGTRNPLSCPLGFAILTWNIDFSRDLASHRLKTALNYLEGELSSDRNPNSHVPAIILFQEIHKACFHTLLSHPFVRATYEVTDISPFNWFHGIHYGAVTLIPKEIASIVSVFRTPFSSSKMGRDALYVDFEFIRQGPSLAEMQKIRLRVANVHLESLSGRGDKARQIQLKSVSQLLSSPEIHAGIVGGDMNAISASDFHLPEQVGLSDAWVLTHPTSLALEGETNLDVSFANRFTPEVDSHTWGYQPPARFPPGRLDKILITGGLKVGEIRRIGVGLKYERPPGLRLGPDRPIWASDHYGLLAKFSFIEKDSDRTSAFTSLD